MKLVFIRHGDPDYSIDSLTPRGWKEAEALAARVAQWEVDDFYVSPLGRAQDTAKVSLDAIGRTAETLDWLREFYVEVDNPVTGENKSRGILCRRSGHSMKICMTKINGTKTKS